MCAHTDSLKCIRTFWDPRQYIHDVIVTVSGVVPRVHTNARRASLLVSVYSGLCQPLPCSHRFPHHPSVAALAINALSSAEKAYMLVKGILRVPGASDRRLHSLDSKTRLILSHCLKFASSRPAIPELDRSSTFMNHDTVRLKPTRDKRLFEYITYTRMRTCSTHPALYSLSHFLPSR